MFLLELGKLGGFLRLNQAAKRHRIKVPQSLFDKGLNALL